MMRFSLALLASGTLLFGACFTEAPTERTLESRLTLEAPTSITAGELVAFTIRLPEMLEPHVVEVIDQQLENDQLLATATRASSTSFRAEWRPALAAEGPYTLRAKIVRPSGEIWLSGAVAAEVRALSTYGKKNLAGLTATPGDGQVALGWPPVRHADRYHVYRGTSAGFARSEESRVADLTATTYLDTAVTNGTRYYYVAAAVVRNKRNGRLREVASFAEVSALPEPPPPPDTLPPAVSITAPPADSTFTSAQTVTIVAQASDNVGVTEVEFYDGATLKHVDSSAPFTYPWTFARADNGTHSLTAKAYDAAGNSAVSPVRQLTVDIAEEDTTPPVASIASPGSDATYTSAGAVTIVVSASDDVGVVKVELYDGGSLVHTDTAAPYSFSWSYTAADNGAHSFTAKAYDAAGNSSTSAPRVLTVDILQPPDTPGGVQAAAGDGQVTLSWSAAASATSYDIYWATTAGVTQSNGNRIAGASSPYAHSERINGLTYYYVVVASNAAGSSAESAEVSATPQPEPDTAPPAFAGLASAQATSNSQIALSWAAAADAVSPPGAIVYDIYQSATPAVDFSAPAHSTSPGDTSYAVSGLTAGTTYYFAVRARDEAGNRDSNTVVRSATTQTNGPPPPFGSTVGATAANFTITDCSNTPFELHAQYQQHPAVVLLYNWTGFT